MAKKDAPEQVLSFAAAAAAAERMVQHYRAFAQLQDVLVAAVNAEAVRGELERAADAAREAAVKAKAEAAKVEAKLEAKRAEVEAQLADVEAAGRERVEEARLRVDRLVEEQRARVTAAVEVAERTIAHNEARAAAATAEADAAERRAGVVREELERLRQRLGA
jgi:chromosome segregation ATPase